MVGMVGLAPTEAVKPSDLQSDAIAAMRHAQGGSDPHQYWSFRTLADARCFRKVCEVLPLAVPTPRREQTKLVLQRGFEPLRFANRAKMLHRYITGA